MSEELVRYCDMDNCDGGKYVYRCEGECGKDVCSLCGAHIGDKYYCKNCLCHMFIELVGTSEIAEMIEKRQKRKRR